MVSFVGLDVDNKRRFWKPDIWSWAARYLQFRSQIFQVGQPNICSWAARYLKLGRECSGVTRVQFQGSTIGDASLFLGGNVNTSTFCILHSGETRVQFSKFWMGAPGGTDLGWGHVPPPHSYATDPAASNGDIFYTILNGGNPGGTDLD